VNVIDLTAMQHTACEVEADATEGTLNGSFAQRAMFFAVVFCLVALRVVWLQSDAYPRLSWSSALLTDEGFYIHNARNLVLFGRERLDGWNNMLIMPLLHLLQVGVFRLFGVGAIQARSISVLTSLMTLVVFRDAARRSWGETVANVATVFLGLDHVNLLYNRMAFMDTPGVLFMVAAWWASVWGSEVAARAHFAARAYVWFGIAGASLVAAYAVRGLAALVIWLPFVFVMDSRRDASDRTLAPRLAISVVVGVGLAGLSYLVLWVQPHRAELAFVNHYYLQYQLLPHSASRLCYNIGMSLGDWQRGLFPYLLKHTPIQFIFALAAACVYTKGLAGGRNSKRSCPASGRVAEQGSWLAMIGWLVILWGFCCTVNYSPSRYYVLFYPAMAALAALGLTQVCNRAARKRFVCVGLLSLWLGINTFWLGDWIVHLTYRQAAADLWLAQHLPADSVVLGAVAPGLCLNNHLHAWNVIQHLCNDDHPVERLGETPAYIVYIDEANWKEMWWTVNYPALVAKDRRLHAFNQLLRPFFVVGVYPANAAALSRYKEIPARPGESDR
jgi:4-amino-4-deoxy-L-arabinose transferase-like glycosyltransferase